MENQILFYNRDKDQYGFLSNFYRSPFLLDGETWSTVEHYYQAFKSTDKNYQKLINQAPTPGKAKRLGDSRVNHPNLANQSLFKTNPGLLRPDWSQNKIEIMYKALEAKFKQNPELYAKLKSTNDSELIEDSPIDSFWGVGDGSGQNMLGKLLMKIRDS